MSLGYEVDGCPECGGWVTFHAPDYMPLFYKCDRTGGCGWSVSFTQIRHANMPGPVKITLRPE